MAVYTTKGGGLGSVLGTMATLGGMATGNPWLTMAGAGMNAMSGNGGAGGLAQALGGATGCWPGMENPAAGSMVEGYDAGTAAWEDWLKRRQGQQQHPVWKGDGAWLQ